MKKKERRSAGKDVSRRAFLKMAGTGAAGLALAGTVPGLILANAQGEEGKPNQGLHLRRWAMVVDLRYCDGHVNQEGAPACVEACNREHFVPPGQQWLQVFEVEGTAGHSFFLPRPCMHCENPPCVKVCPVGATYRTDEGVVLINHERCIGCRMCMAACPYGVRKFNWEQPPNPPGATFASYSPEFPVPHRRGTVEKCMLCAHLLEDGKLPACVDACPKYALYVGDLTEDIATNGRDVVRLSRFLADNHVFRLKEELGTRPRVWYIPGHGELSGHTVDEPVKHVERPRTWQEQEKAQGAGT